MPPMRPGSTSGRRCRNAIAALMSLPAAPAPGVRVAFALAFAAAVEQQDAVAVAGQHPRVLLRPTTAGERDHRGAVARRHVPALELEPVAGRELDVLIGDAEVVGRHDGPPDMRRDVAEADRQEDEERDERRGDAEQSAAGIAPPEAALGPARAPQGDDAEAEEQQTCGDRDQAGEVVTGRSELARVVQGLDPGGDPEHAEDQRDRAPTTAAQSRIRPHREPEHGERNQAADQVIAGRRSGLRLHEVVVEHVHRDDEHAEREDRGLTPDGAGGGAPPAPPRERGGGGRRRGRGHRHS